MKALALVFTIIFSFSSSFAALPNSSQRLKVNPNNRFHLVLAEADLQARRGEVQSAAMTLSIVLEKLHTTRYHTKTKAALLQEALNLKESIQPSLDEASATKLENAVHNFRRQHPQLSQYL